jgi:hypothetical protein
MIYVDVTFTTKMKALSLTSPSSTIYSFLSDGRPIQTKASLDNAEAMKVNVHVRPVSVMDNYSSR